MWKRKKRRQQGLESNEEVCQLLGDNLNFATAEAYKLLRTNLNFSFPDGAKCMVIGVTSAVSGEGKSVTSANIAYTMAQSGRRVLLLEADMRLPTLAGRLHIRRKPGLSNLLAGQCSGNDILQKTQLQPNLWVAAAGDIPPNPAELLGSGRMAATLEALSVHFDVVIVDLPPVTAVADALVVSKQVDGMVIVVRQDYSDRISVEETVRQLRFAEARILGFVMTDADLQKKKYKRYGSYRAYGEAAAGGKKT